MDKTEKELWAIIEQLPQDDPRTREMSRFLANISVACLEGEHKLRRVLGDEHTNNRGET